MENRDDHYPDARFEHRPGGYIIIDGKEVAHTLQCAHCNMHFISTRGSGNVRGFCLNCNQVTCGTKACNVCLPYERKMEIEEQRWKETQMQREVAIEQQIKKIERRYGKSLTIGGAA